MEANLDLAAFAREYGYNAAALRALVDELSARSNARAFYVFSSQRAGGAGAPPDRRRLLLAFPTPDSALAFAQHNRLTAEERPRLRRLELLQLIGAVLREPAIEALLLAAESGDDDPPAGRFPDGVRIERAELLRRLGQADL